MAAGSASQALFVSTMAPYAAQVAQATGNSTQEILGQWALESGWGQGNQGTNNPGSIMPGGNLASYSSLGAFANADIAALQADGMTGYANNPAGYAQAASAYDPGNSNYSASVLSTIESIPAQGVAQGVAVSLPGVNSATTLPVLANTGSSLSSTGPAAPATAGTGTTKGNVTSTGGCAFSLTNFPSWFVCEAWNLLFIGLGLLILGGVVMKQIDGSVDLSNLPIPPIE